MKHRIRLCSSVIALAFALAVSVANIAVAAAPDPAEKSPDKPSLHPRYREWASPQNGVEVKNNPPALLWPAAPSKSARYKIRLSQSSAFPKDTTIESGEISWAEYSTHKKLQPGKWYWQYATLMPREPNTSANPETWSPVYDFNVTSDTTHSHVFETPTLDEFLALCAVPHPRMLVTEQTLPAFRERNKDSPDATVVLRFAKKNLNAPLTAEAPTRPRDTTGVTGFNLDVLTTFMYHKFGDKLLTGVQNQSLAYLLTGDAAHAREAIRQALHISTMDPKGNATKEDFNSASCMLAMAMAYDTGYAFLTAQEKRQLLDAIQIRGSYFFRQYHNEFEVHSMDNHVWQHTLRRFFMTSLAMLNELPEAKTWLAYCYETWCCRFPILGGDDGGWHDGASYYGVNFETFIMMPLLLRNITGVDFFQLPWYKNAPYFLIYSFPKNSFATGFGDAFEEMLKPTPAYLAYADAYARELRNPFARYYADSLANGDPAALDKVETFRLYRMLTTNPRDDVKPQSPAALPQSRVFPDAGFALMHTHLDDAKKDLMATFMSVPFGATGHAHAAHNGFTISYGGKELFSGSGYYSNFNDPHTLMHYRTRGHNTIVVDGMSQAIGENSYGWIARFADTPDFTYALGDATHAYGPMTSAFWIDRMKKSEVYYTLKNGFGDPGVKRFRRHFILLRPSTVVIYDELEAATPVTWTWLLHSYQQLSTTSSNDITGHNSAVNARVRIFSNHDQSIKITDQFFSPAINWKKRTEANGEPQDYANQWHAEVTPTEKSNKMRFLAIVQIDKKGANPAPPPSPDSTGTITIGPWKITATLDAKQPAALKITNTNGDEIAYEQGKPTHIKDSSGTKDLSDTLPDVQ